LAERTLQHYRTIQALTLILGSERKNVEYDCIGAVTENDADELIEFVKQLKDEVETWLEKEDPGLV